MSTTYSFVCDDCKVKCWAGQGEDLYSYDYVAKFLHDHVGHKLRFLNDLVEDKKSLNYVDCEEKQREKDKQLVLRMKAELEGFRKDSTAFGDNYRMVVINRMESLIKEREGNISLPRISIENGN